ncbi:hypothetical protein [Streptosporangium sp. NPDC006007]|uniref:glycine-rich domain-containing protein n=1 Tax=Streptosporangium sp. NPDC006007 TaxID=3154575 RepID=UPI0033BF2B69
MIDLYGKGLVGLANDSAATPRTLITPELFTRLTKRIAAEHPEHADIAEPIMEQTLAFLAACAAHPTVRLAPSELVDLGWHAFVLYTREYADFCHRVAGQFIHHVPDDTPDRPSSGSTASATVTVMRDLGLPVINDLWSVKANCEGKCKPDPCSQCHQGCTDSN